MDQLDQIDLENRLLSSTTSQKDLVYAQDCGVSRDTFVIPSEARHPEIWDYVEDHVRGHGKTPSDDDLRVLFGFEPTDQGDLRTYVTLARKRELTRNLRSIFERRPIQLPGD